MKKVLFLLGMYSPNYSANGICCKNVIELLDKEGYQISCICNAYGKNFLPFKDGNIFIYPIKQRFHQRVAQMGDNLRSKKIKYILKKISIFISKVQLLIMTPLWPLTSPLYLNNFYKKAVELQKKEKFDIVISVYTPFESLYAGYKLKKKFPGIKMIVYYLDALAGGWGPSYLTKEFINKKAIKQETIINEMADLVISMNSSKNYHKNNSSNTKINRVFLDVPVMIKREKYTDIKTEFCAVYAGNLSYSGRSIIPILNIFKIICNKINLNFYLIGECTCIEKYRCFVEATNGRIKFLGRKTYEEVLEYEKKAKYLVNIGSSNPYTLPSKIFEYMSFKKTIISTYSISNEPSIEYLKKYKNVFFVNENECYEKTANDLIELMCSDDKKNIENLDLENIFYLNTPSAFVKIINCIKKEDK